MANKDRQKRSARQARAREREALQAAQLASQPESSKDKGVVKAETKEVKAKEESGKAKAKAKDKNKKKGPFARIGQYFHDVRVEMGRVVWPSPHELKNYSVAVILMLIFFGFAVWAVDTGLVAALYTFTGLRG